MARGFVLSAALVAALAGCGAQASAASDGAPPNTCTRTATRVLAKIADGIYGEAAHGADVTSAVARVERSTALATAVGRGDATATRAALRPLLRADIHRIVVLRGRRTLASFGGPGALGPARGVIRNAAGAPVGRFVLASGTAAGIAGVIRSVTGAQVVVGGSGGATAIAAEAFPSGPLRIALRFPAPARCGPTPAATVADTIGAVGERLFTAERDGAQVRHVLRVVARDPRFARAVRADDPAALRTQIVRFFKDPHLHVVRIRATDAHGRLVNDVGGPFVLAPASAPVELHGRRVGTATLSIQDDTGYIKLMRRFTGAGVALYTAGGAVPGSTPLRGEVFSFTATAFPSGPLRISLSGA